MFKYTRNENNFQKQNFISIYITSFSDLFVKSRKDFLLQYFKSKKVKFIKRISHKSQGKTVEQAYFRLKVGVTLSANVYSRNRSRGGMIMEAGLKVETTCVDTTYDRESLADTA